MWCEKFIKRNTGKKNVVPRWAARAKQLNYCMVEGCGKLSYIRTNSELHKSIQNWLQHLNMVWQVINLRVSMLTTNIMYRERHFPEPCATCSTPPKYRGRHARQCQDPDHISAFLKQTIDFEAEFK